MATAWLISRSMDGLVVVFMPPTVPMTSGRACIFGENFYQLKEAINGSNDVQRLVKVLGVLISIFTAISIGVSGVWTIRGLKDKPQELFELRLPANPTGPQTQSLLIEPVSEIKFRNITRQAYDYSCGSAALVTLLNADLGIKVTEQQAMEGMMEHGEKEKIIERRGFSLLDMKRYVGNLGKKSDGFRGEIVDLMELKTPAIVPIDYAGFKHFVVLRGIRDGIVYVADPSAGNIIFSMKEFVNLWDRNTLFIIYRDEDDAYPKKLALTDKELGVVDMDLVKNQAILAPLNDTLRINRLVNGYDGISIRKR